MKTTLFLTEKLKLFVTLKVVLNGKISILQWFEGISILGTGDLEKNNKGLKTS